MADVLENVCIATKKCNWKEIVEYRSGNFNSILNNYKVMLLFVEMNKILNKHSKYGIDPKVAHIKKAKFNVSRTENRTKFLKRKPKRTFKTQY